MNHSTRRFAAIALRAALCAVLAGALLCGCGKSPQPSPQGAGGNLSEASGITRGQGGPGLFEDVTQRTGITFVHQLADGRLSNIMESDGAGGTVLDYDGDGFMDLYFVNGSGQAPFSEAPAGTPRQPNRLYRNRGNGTFEDVTAKAGVEGFGFGTAAAAADYDNDGDTDLYVVNFDGGILYRNEGNGAFKEVTAAAGVKTKRAGISATFFDADRDGWLDLFVANYLVFDPAVRVQPGGRQPYPGPLAYAAELNLLFRNRGNGTFEDISQAAGVQLPNHRAMSVTAVDYDLDGNDDLYIANDATPNVLLAGDGQGHFRDVAARSGVAFDQLGEAGGSMGAAVGDLNGDGYPDFLVPRLGNPSLYVSSAKGVYEDRCAAAGVFKLAAQYTGWGGNFLDFDNDGDLDIFLANGNPHAQSGMACLLFENLGNGVFTNAAAAGGEFFFRSVNARGSAVVDWDNDGRPDLVISTLGGPPILLHNRSTSGNHWLTLRLQGTRGNRDGFGAQVRLKAGGRTWTAEARCPTTYVFQQDPRLHFGLGQQRQADEIQVQWPNGQKQVLTNVPADQILRVEEPK